MPGDRARKAGKRAGKQARGTYRNTRDLVGSFTFDQVLPGGIAGFIQELLSLFPKALGRGSGKQQVYSSTTLIIIVFISTPFTAGTSLILAVPFTGTLTIGLIRMVPAANEGFRSARGTRLRDRDVPLWKRD